MDRRYVLVASLALLVMTVPAGATTWTFESGHRAGSADFQVSGSNLVVTLTNTSTSDVLVPVDLLNAGFTVNNHIIKIIRNRSDQIL